MKTQLLALATLALVACGGQKSSTSTAKDDNADTPSADQGDAGEAAATSHLVRQVLTCTTSDGLYSVSIGDNQGIGLQRTSNLYATVRDANDNVVGSFAPLKEVRSSLSISFGHMNYIDSKSNGAKFTLMMPSTNTPYGVVAKLKDGTEIKYGQRFDATSQGDLSCSAN